MLQRAAFEDASLERKKKRQYLSVPLRGGHSPGQEGIGENRVRP